MKSLFTLLMLPILGIYDAFVLVKLWAWFAVPALHVSPITKIQAYGLMMLLTVALYKPDGEGTKPGHAILQNIFADTLALAAGYVLVVWFAH